MTEFKRTILRNLICAVAFAAACVYVGTTTAIAADDLESAIIKTPAEAATPTDQEAALPQTAESAKPESSMTRVFRVHSGDAQELFLMVQNLMSGPKEFPRLKWVIAGRTNSIVMRGTKESLDQLTQMISDLEDKLMQSASEESLASSEVVKVFRIKHNSPEALAHTLENILPDVRMSWNVFGGDKEPNIIAAGPEKSLEKLEAILRRVDIPKSAEPMNKPVGVRLRVVWLADGPPAADDESTALAEDLKAVVEELAHMGLKNVQQVGQTVIDTHASSSFSIACTPHWRGWPAPWHMKGNLSLGPTPKTFLLQSSIDSRMVVTDDPEANAKIAEARAEISLQTVVRQFEYTVLGVVPTGKTSSIFVVQLIPVEQQ